MVVFAASTALSSCKDDKDEPKGGSELVGTWYWYDDDYDEIDYDDYFTFKSDGTFFASLEGDGDLGRYTYDSKTGILVLNWSEGYVERGRITIKNNILDLDDDEFGYGIYIRK